MQLRLACARRAFPEAYHMVLRAQRRSSLLRLGIAREYAQLCHRKRVIDAIPSGNPSFVD